MPKISVIMPVYNAMDTIAAAVESVLKQGFRDYELILVDDGSTDLTGELLAAYAQTDRRIRVITRAGGGPGQARNAGLDAATGEYVLLIDADDRLTPDCLQTFASRLDAAPDLVICGYLLIEPDAPERLYTRGDITCYTHALFLKLLPELIAGQLAYVPWNKLIKRSLIEQHGIRFTDYRSCEDRLFNLECFAHTHLCTFIEAPLYRYYAGHESLNNRFLPNRLEALDAFYARLLELYDGKPDGRASAVFAAAYLKGLYACILSTLHPSCDLSGADKRRYIRAVLNATYRADAIRDARGGQLALPKLALKTKSVILCRGCARLIRFADRHMHGAFLKLKIRKG